MLVQPDQNPPSQSVKLRRKNRDLNNERNRYSGGDFLLGSPMSRGQFSRPPQTGEMMRKSGDWSYVGFPTSKSPPVTPKFNPKGRPLSLMQNQQPISLLETKVMASIINNENKTKSGRKSLEVSKQKSHFFTILNSSSFHFGAIL